ncbi:hypothetical protein [Mangrovicella endophytica]|uniref:hypothetical protein n=1 Tax=Mangrovicella endophytica TaxID=2066697 RepID=UPI000C9EC06E|nr:hypothetical protein [Mangrovicella endophytica]
MGDIFMHLSLSIALIASGVGYYFDLYRRSTPYWELNPNEKQKKAYWIVLALWVLECLLIALNWVLL